MRILMNRPHGIHFSFRAKPMKISRIPSLLTCLMLSLTASACASAPQPDVGTPPRSSDQMSAAELEALYYARTDSAFMNVHQADVDFMTGMIAHHAQALVMSGYAPDNGANGQVRILASRIINAQKDEIGLMQRWLRDRKQEVPEVSDAGQTMGGGMNHAGHDMLMTGMLTPEQLEELSRAQGSEFDRLFLTYMIQHHNGAVTMVHELFATDGAAQDDLVFKLASDIQVDQITEVARMQGMLDALPAPPRDR